MGLEKLSRFAWTYVGTRTREKMSRAQRSSHRGISQVVVRRGACNAGDFITSPDDDRVTALTTTSPIGVDHPRRGEPLSFAPVALFLSGPRAGRLLWLRYVCHPVLDYVARHQQAPSIVRTTHWPLSIRRTRPNVDSFTYVWTLQGTLEKSVSECFSGNLCDPESKYWSYFWPQYFT